MRYIFENRADHEIPVSRGQSARPAADLRRGLSERNIAWAHRNRFAHEVSLGEVPVVLYREDEQSRHGNFHPASYPRILQNTNWNLRLKKVHTTARKVLLSREHRCELDSSNSSDALLMSIFCHPQLLRADCRLRSLLGIDRHAEPTFGYKPRIPLKKNSYDSTEIDLRIGNLLVEAKLTEFDFQTAPWRLLERYRDLEEVFEVEELPRSGESWLSYQLLRGILAAHAEADTRFCVFCDDRRPDLIASWYRILQCVRYPELRCRLGVLTWQEIAAACAGSVQRWLREKYGIILPGSSQPATGFLTMPD
ncbi:MAG: hypothetical protein WA708_00740 [Acidobacteriaceae bacterium]